MKKIILTIGLLIILAVFVFAGIYFSSSSSTPSMEVPCTMEAKICPDGSAVGRSGPLCEFAECPRSQFTPKPQLAKNDVVLSVGQNIKVGTLSITLDSIVEDSRCPSDVQCIWAGQVVVKLSLLNGMKSELVKSSLNQDPYLFDNYSIKIVSVEPIPKSGEAISAGEYKVTVHVE